MLYKCNGVSAILSDTINCAMVMLAALGAAQILRAPFGWMASNHGLMYMHINSHNGLKMIRMMHGLGFGCDITSDLLQFVADWKYELIYE